MNEIMEMVEQYLRDEYDFEMPDKEENETCYDYNRRCKDLHDKSNNIKMTLLTKAEEIIKLKNEQSFTKYIK